MRVKLVSEGLTAVCLSPAACHPATRRSRCVTLREIFFKTQSFVLLCCLSSTPVRSRTWDFSFAMRQLLQFIGPDKNMHNLLVTVSRFQAEFQRLALGFKCDMFTLEKRLRLEERSRDLAEENVRREVSSCQGLLQVGTAPQLSGQVSLRTSGQCLVELESVLGFCEVQFHLCLVFKALPLVHSFGSFTHTGTEFTEFYM